jgi:hypothetical protein
MRDSTGFILVIIVTVIFVGVAGFLYFGDSTGRAMVNSFVNQVPELRQFVPKEAEAQPAPALTPEAEAAKLEAKKEEQLAARKLETAAKTEKAKPSAPRRDPAFLNFAPRAAAQPVFPFPSAGDVRQGMEIQSLQASFGRPTIRATTMEKETLVETYVYVKNEPRSATIVRLKDGKVVEAQNGIY